MSYTPDGLVDATKGARDAGPGQPASAATTAASITRINERLEERLRLFGAGLTAFYWLLGDHDMLAVVEANSDVEVAGVVLWLAAQAGVTTTTMRAYDLNTIGAGNVAAGASVASILYRCYADLPEGD
jgi:uncharacterized protein with GYD domain